MSATKQIISIDASSLSHSSCIRDFNYTVVQGYKEPRQSSAMVYGTAVHKFIDTMFKTNSDIPKARDAMLKSFRVPKIDKRNQMYLSDEIHLISTCNWLWFSVIMSNKDEFEILKLNDEPATEINFSIPFYEDEYLMVNISGTIDKIGKFKNGIYAIGDWKTSSSSEPKIHVESYDMSAQLRMYTLALRLMAKHFPDSTLGKIGAEKSIGAFIDGIYIRPKANDNEMMRSDVYVFSDKDIEEYKLNLVLQCEKLSDAIMSGQFPRQGIMNGSCKKAYGKCSFYNVCRQEQDHLRALMLTRDFIKTPYNPLMFHD